jgi:hypothetical protein
MPARRFPPPWTVEELDAGFVVRDHDGQEATRLSSDGRVGADRRFPE